MSNAKPAINTHDYKEIESLYGRGCFLQAYQRGVAQFGELKKWSDETGLLLAGRLANQLGAPRLSNHLHIRAYRNYPQSLGVKVAYGYVLWEWRGPFVAWDFIRHINIESQHPAIEQVDYFTLFASLHSAFHDFSTAEDYLQKASEFGERPHWIHVSYAHLYENADQIEKAESAVRSALQLFPYYRPAVQMLARLLHNREQDDEAISLLTEAIEKTESATLTSYLSSIYDELKQPHQVLTCLDHYVARSPLLEKNLQQWVTARRADSEYLLGNFTAYKKLSLESENKFHLKAVGYLERSSAEAKRVLLEVPFILQHHMTCAPATLAMLSRYWQIEADHLALADAICYDGTPDYRERGWAEEAGFWTKEFTVTWDAIVFLIDHGIPFTLTTVEITSAHLQAVVGYDARRKSVLIRDPGARFVREALAEPLLNSYAAFGPRGMVIIPAHNTELIESINLPDISLYDMLHQVRKALSLYDRVTAETAAVELEKIAPGHRISLMARRNIANYDGDTTTSAHCSNKLAELYPDNQAVIMSQLYDIPEHQRQDEIDKLEAIIADPEKDASFTIRLAGFLCWDKRYQDRAEKLVRSSLRKLPLDARAIRILAVIQWENEAYAYSAKLYRLCTCIENADENYARSYFKASRYLGATNDALQFLQKRADVAITRSPNPAKTLFWALDVLHRTSDGFTALENVLTKHGDDGYLLLFLAQEYIYVGDYEKSQELLTRAKGITRSADWLAVSADLIDKQGDRQRSLQEWYKVLEENPLSMPAHRKIAVVLNEITDESAAIDHLQKSIEKTPHLIELHELLIRWLANQSPKTVEPAIRRLIALNPEDAWTQRELGWCLLKQKRFTEAQPVVDKAFAIDGKNTGNFNLRGDLLLAQNDVLGAQEAWRDAILIGADNTYAVDRLMHSLRDADEKRKQLRLLKQELERQVLSGEGVEAFRTHAQNVLPAIEILQTLEAAYKARPDLWQVWTALIAQHTTMDHINEAHALSKKMTEQLPLLPRSWLELADAAELRQDAEEEKDALIRALKINPAWSVASRRLSSVYITLGDVEKAKTVLQNAIQQDPRDSGNYSSLAEHLLNQHQHEEAFNLYEKAINLDPGDDWVWNRLIALAPQRARALAQLHIENRGHEPRAWYRLAQVLEHNAPFKEQLQAIDHALELNPRFIGAYVHKAKILVYHGFFEEALALDKLPVWEGSPPDELVHKLAEMEMEANRNGDAIRRLEKLVEQQPENFNSWRYLAGLYHKINRKEKAISAAKKLVELRPRESRSWGYLGDAYLLAKKTDDAMKSLHRALEIDPTYSFAANKLFDHYMEIKNYDKARDILQCLQRHDPGGWTCANEVKLAVATNELTPALNAMRHLCGDIEAPADSLNEAAEDLVRAKHGDSLCDILNEVIELPIGSRQRFYLWTKYWVPKQSPRSCAERIAKIQNLIPRGEAEEVYLDWLSENAPLKQLQAFVAERKESLAQRHDTWGMVGYALYTKGAYRDAVNFLSDWESRSDVQAWALTNLCASLRNIGREQEALQIAQHVLTLKRDHSFVIHGLWVACDYALRGDAEKADSLIKQCETNKDFHRALMSLADAARLLLDQKTTTYTSAKIIKRAVNDYETIFSSDNGLQLRRMITKIATAMARRSGVHWHLWGWWKRWQASGLKVW